MLWWGIPGGSVCWRNRSIPAHLVVSDRTVVTPSFGSFKRWMTRERARRRGIVGEQAEEVFARTVQVRGRDALLDDT